MHLTPSVFTKNSRQIYRWANIFLQTQTEQEMALSLQSLLLD